jgi:hypothetical protein
VILTTVDAEAATFNRPILAAYRLTTNYLMSRRSFAMPYAYQQGANIGHFLVERSRGRLASTRSARVHPLCAPRFATFQQAHVRAPRQRSLRSSCPCGRPLVVCIGLFLTTC